MVLSSISKLTNLASAKVNRPQIYVALQLVVVVAKQMVFLTIALIFVITTKANETVDSKYMSLEWAFGLTKVIDTFLMPTITQITYLGCNRRNVMTLWKSLKPNCCKSNAVDPNVPLNYMENMETTQQ
ncbi:hypothetical protein L3Y34_009722 [Caenorhabditis briggsae]|uniref:Serpentine receptor class gamma n=1 Tax=Caenorhabditis briggsae TaxID=6238 RepID=A0AAE9D2R8_CAEBR|nr:hypothetical protein L3Y34_009722 [Caenorhabditis briggsae]